MKYLIPLLLLCSCATAAEFRGLRGDLASLEVEIREAGMMTTGVERELKEAEVRTAILSQRVTKREEASLGLVELLGGLTGFGVVTGVAVDRVRTRRRKLRREPV